MAREVIAWVVRWYQDVKIFLVTLTVAGAAAAFALGPRDADACGMASQYRLLPLGTTGDRVIALELDQFRSWDTRGAKTQTVWSMSARLVAIAPEGEAREIEKLGAVTVPAKRYERELAPLFQKALARARSQRGFEPVTLVRRTECGLRARCGAARIVAKEGRFPAIRFSVRGRAHRATARFPAPFLAHQNAFPGLSDAERKSADASAALAKHPGIGAGWSLGSTRLYRAKDRWFAVHDIATGDVRFMARVAAPTRTHAHKPVAASFHQEPVAHHGHNFDLLVPLQ